MSTEFPLPNGMKMTIRTLRPLDPIDGGQWDADVDGELLFRVTASGRSSLVGKDADDILLAVAECVKDHLARAEWQARIRHSIDCP